MRYPITQVLQGVAAYRFTLLGTARTEAAALEDEIAHLQELRGQSPAAAAALLQELATDMGQVAAFDREACDKVIAEVRRLERNTPSHYDVVNKGRQLERKLEQVKQISTEATAQDTRLERFLRAVQDGGETHVSQHSLKQAGFDTAKLTDFVLAAEPQAGS